MVVALTLVTDAWLHKRGVFPPLGEYTPDKPLVLATAYRVIFGIVGSYLTARLAPYRPMKHALIGGAIGMVLGVVGAIATLESESGAALVSGGVGGVGIAASVGGREMVCEQEVGSK